MDDGFPAVGMEVPSIRGDDPAVAERFGQNNQRGVRKIHGQGFMLAFRITMRGHSENDG